MMNKQHSAEADFNRNAEEGGENKDSQRMKRARGGVIYFHEAEEDLRKEMLRIMDPIDKAPNSFEAVISYGNAPLDKLGKVANEMIRVQTKFNNEVNVMASAFDKLENGIKDMNLDTFGEATRKALQGMAGAAGTGVKGVGKFMRSMWDSVSGAKAKRTEDEKVVKEMQEALPQMLEDLLKMVKNIENTEKGIIEVTREAEKLGKARTEATREISVYLGAAKEVLRRYDEDYIPEAREVFEESGDPEDEIFMKEVIKRREDFEDRIMVLEGSRAQSVIAAQQLMQMIETMEDQRKKIQDILRNGQNEWKAMLVAAGIAGSSLKVAQTIKKADEMGDRMHDQTQHMIEQAHELTQNSKARGTIDPQKLIEAAQRLERLLESEAENREKRRVQIEATSKALRGATDKLIEAAESSSKARQIEAVRVAEENAEKARKEREDAANNGAEANDNSDSVATPAAADKPAAPRRRSPRGPK